jgi:hypothetical protein
MADDAHIVDAPIRRATKQALQDGARGASS